MTDPVKSWHFIRVQVGAGGVEAVEFALNSFDTTGTEVDLPMNTQEIVEVVGFFEECPRRSEFEDELGYALGIYGLERDVVHSIEFGQIQQADWLAEWKKHWKPTVIGKFVIAPPWETVDATEKLIIRIEPNMAFGTGTHATTQLCLAEISDHLNNENTFLDIGTGTGILAIAAASITDGNILACDTDLESIRIARANAERNSVAAKIDFFEGPVDKSLAEFDFICANLTLDVILPLLPLLIGRARHTLVLSGILEEQRTEIANALHSHGVNDPDITQRGEWIALTVQF